MDGDGFGNESEEQEHDNHAREAAVCINNTTQTLQGHAQAVIALAGGKLNPTLLASGSKDFSARLWDTEAEKCISVLKGHVGAVRSCCFSLDERILFTAGDTCVNIWDRCNLVPQILPTMIVQCAKIDTLHRCMFNLKSFESLSPPWSCLLSSGLSRRATGQSVGDLRGHQGHTTSVNVGMKTIGDVTDGMMLLSSAYDGTSKVRDLLVPHWRFIADFSTSRFPSHVLSSQVWDLRLLLPIRYSHKHESIHYA